MPDDDRDHEDVLVYLHFDSDDLADYLTRHPLFQKPTPPAHDAPPPAATEEVPSSHSTRKTLRLRFLPDSPTGKHGLLIGSSPSCHIALNHPSIAKFHGTLTFDEHHRLVYRDLGSWHGSSVVYELSDFPTSTGTPDLESRRRDFTWVVGGPDVPAGAVVICLGGQYSILLTVPPRDWTSPRHQRHVARFLTASRGHDKDLMLQSEVEADLARSPGPAAGPKPVFRSRPLFVPTRVRRFEAEWNVSTAKLRVIKYAKCVQSQELKNWGREVLRWKNLDHRNIAQCLDTNLAASNPGDPALPRIYLEYAPHGSLRSLQSPLHYKQAESVTHQCLDALAYLHERNLVHRSIKPSKILVTSMDPIHVQLTDFGAATLSDRAEVLRSSAPWFAPEMHADLDTNGYRIRRGINGEVIAFDRNGGRAAAGEMAPLEYGPAVDIWALGVVAMDLWWPGKLPAPGKHTWTNPRWKLISDALARDERRDFESSRWLTFIKNKMLVTDPAGRQTARACLPEVEALRRRHAHRDNRPAGDANPRLVVAAQKPEEAQGQPARREEPVQDAAAASGAGTRASEPPVVTVTEQPPAPPNPPPLWEVDWEGDVTMTGMDSPTRALPWLVDWEGDVIMTDAPCLS